MSFVSFDGLVERFQGQIYQSHKGRLRMRLIDSLYRQYLPIDSVHDARVLDAAGGLGQMSHWFLEAGGQVDYFDVSEEMVQATQGNLSKFYANGQLNIEQASIVGYQPVRPYEFVNVHAVLEWLEKPEETLSAMSNWVAPNGYIGLMVYNKHMLMLRHLMRGTLSRAMSGDLGGEKGGLTPISPMEPEQVRQQLVSQGFEIKTQAGIRSFSDLTEKTILDWYPEEDIFNAELTLCEKRPYCDMARYVLFIARKIR
jgi:S-adenosylmethionine-dependent methyltransferase